MTSLDVGVIIGAVVAVVVMAVVIVRAFRAEVRSERFKD